MVRQLVIEPNSRCGAGQRLVELEDPELASKITELDSGITGLQTVLRGQMSAAAAAKDQEQMRKAGLEIASTRAKLDAKVAERRDLIRINNADPNRAGWFNVVAPPFSSKRASTHRPEWTVLDPDFR